MPQPNTKALAGAKYSDTSDNEQEIRQIEWITANQQSVWRAGMAP